MSESLMAMAWRMYRHDNWMHLPFDRRDFAVALRSAHEIRRGRWSGRFVTDAERRQIGQD